MKQILLCIILTVTAICTAYAQTPITPITPITPPATDTAAYTKAVAVLQADLFRFFHTQALPAVQHLSDSVQTLLSEPQRAPIKTMAPRYTQLWHSLNTVQGRLRYTNVKGAQLKDLRKQAGVLETKKKTMLANWKKAGLPASFQDFVKLAPDATTSFTEWFDAELKKVADTWFTAYGSVTDRNPEFWRHYATDVTRRIAACDLDEERILLWDGTVYGNDLSAYPGIPPAPPPQQ